MKVSKISRSLVVAIFVVSISYIIWSGLGSIFNSNINNLSFNKLIYVGLLILFTYVYGHIKSKFSRKKIKRKVGLTYRYIYVMVVTVFCKLFYITMNIPNMGMYSILFNVLLIAISSVLIKKIIYNISKSDILSVFGIFIYAVYPVTSLNVDVFTKSNLIVLITMIAIFFIQKLIDELKQIGIKNRKYIILSVIIAIVISISMILGVNSLIWIILSIVMLFIAENLDRSNVNFPELMISKLSQVQKEKLYKIERIYLSKLIICICLTFVLTIVSYFVIRSFIFAPVTNIFITIKDIFQSNITTTFNNIKLIVENSTMFYTVICSYILLIEILTVLLKRRYDTKSTLIKSLFVLSLFIYSSLNIDVILYNNLLIVLITIIAIISTSNLYLNREERIKLLKA